MQPTFLNRIAKYWPFIVIVTLYIVQAVYYSTRFIFPVVDADQLVMADMATFYSQGFIPEPYFWGQNYLFPLESWVATPLVFFNVRADIAICLVSVTAFYLPYLAATFLAIKARRILLFFIAGLIPFVLPPAYIIATMIPRNFGTTSSLVALGIILLITRSESKTLSMSAGAIIGICFASNPATAILAPALLFATTRKRWKFWAPGLLIGAFGIYALGYFYVLNPEAIHYHPEPIALSLEQLKDSLKTQEILFYPLLLAAITAPAVIIAWIQSSKRNRRFIEFVLFGTALFCLGFLATDRISSYTLSPFYSSYRFWTVLPLLGVVIVTSALCSHSEKAHTAKKYSAPIAIVLLTVALVAQTVLAENRSGSYLTLPTPTGIENRAKVAADCKSLASSIDISRNYVELSQDDPWLMYGCYSMEGAVVTYFEKDRRTWLPKYIDSRGLVRVEK